MTVVNIRNIIRSELLLAANQPDVAPQHFILPTNNSSADGYLVLIASSKAVFDIDSITFDVCFDICLQRYLATKECDGILFWIESGRLYTSLYYTFKYAPKGYSKLFHTQTNSWITST